MMSLQESDFSPVRGFFRIFPPIFSLFCRFNELNSSKLRKTPAHKRQTNSKLETTKDTKRTKYGQMNLEFGQSESTRSEIFHGRIHLDGWRVESCDMPAASAQIWWQGARRLIECARA
jgi:hypothetical protein